MADYKPLIYNPISGFERLQSGDNLLVETLIASEIYGYRPSIDVSASKSLTLTDYGTCQRIIASSAVVITVPKDASLDFDIGTEIEITQDGAGSLTLAQEDSEINIRRYGSAAVTGHVLIGQYAACVLKKVAADEWRVYGGF